VAALVVFGALVSGGSVFAASPTDASVNNYQQCANDKPGSVTPTVDPTDCVPQGWINGILNAQNSQYAEDQVTAQRLGLDIPSGGPTSGRTITIRYLARKGQGGVGNHAYDYLATWNFTQANADRCQDLLAADCPGGSANTFPIPSDPTVVADSNGAGSSTALHELPQANRQMTMYGGTITAISTPVHDNASGSGDDFATITVTYSVASTATDTKVQLLFGGHLAASSGPRGWGNNVGSAFIKGGPYHIKIDLIDGTSIGNRDNQINSAAILPIGTQTQTALHETNSVGVDVNPANNQDPATQTGITVTLPTNGSGTYVTDYATVAPPGSTGTVAFRFYSSQAACNADTTFTGGTSAGSGKTLDANSVAKSDPVHITAAGVTYWRAVFTGTGISAGSDSGCSGEILTANQATSTATTLHETNSNGVDVNPANNGDPISINAGGFVTDFASVTPASATGSVAFKYYGSQSDCTNDTNGTAAGGGTLSSGSAHSNTVQFNTSGTFYWKAFFTGTGLNNASHSGCEVLNVPPNSTGLTTTPSETTGRIGDTLSDTATLSGATSDAGGTISFYLFAPGDDCSELGTAVYSSTDVPVEGNDTYSSTDGTASGSNVTTQAGVYHWLAKYSGDDNNDPASSKCSDEAVLVISPHITILKTPDQQTIVAGQTATFTIQVINDGDSTLTNVVVTDALAPGCARTSADIPGLALMKPAPDSTGTITYTCTLANVTTSFTNTAVATGKPPVGPNVSSQDTAAVTVVPPVTHPAISIVKDPKSQTVTKGGTATFTITVLNTGDVALTNVVVTDALSPNCNKTIGTLAPGQSVNYQCTRPNVQSSFTNVAIVTGQAGGTTLTAQDTAPVTTKAAALKPKTVKKVIPKVVSHRKPKATG